MKGGEQGEEWGGRGAGWGGLLLGNADWSMGGGEERGEKVEEVEVGFRGRGRGSIRGG